MKVIAVLFIILTISACGTAESYINEYAPVTDPSEKLGIEIVDIADMYRGFHERTNRKELREFIDLDPYNYEWCAAFINAVLHEKGLPGSELVSDYPLMARSFMTWGEEVTGEPQTGDIVVFPRGNQGWQGHVGIFIVSYEENGREYYIILGGNQDDEVNYTPYPANRAIAVRRWPVD